MDHKIKEHETVWATIGAGVFALFAFVILLIAAYFFIARVSGTF